MRFTSERFHITFSIAGSRCRTMLYDSESDRDPSRLRIAQVAPLYERVPPHLYGGSERIVSYLTEELVGLGHDVTCLRAATRRQGAASCRPAHGALWRDPRSGRRCRTTCARWNSSFRESARFDVIHFHMRLPAFPARPASPVRKRDAHCTACIRTTCRRLSWSTTNFRWSRSRTLNVVRFPTPTGRHGLPRVAA